MKNVPYFPLLMNWPPATMATQHPDNAIAPWWKKDDPFVSTQDEIKELDLLLKNST